jgi:hypothetical protein
MTSYRKLSKEQLLEIIESDDIRKTHALEAVGYRLSKDEALPILQKYLKHDDPIIREGCFYALEHMDHDEDIRDIIFEAYKSETHAGLKEIALDVIFNYHCAICEEVLKSEECICHWKDR